MISDVYKKKLDQSVLIQRVLILVIGLLGIIVLYLTHALVNKVEEQKTIISPPEITKEIVIQGDKLSLSYMQQMADRFSTLLFNYSPSSARDRFDRLLFYVHTDRYDQIKEFLYSQASIIEEKQISSYFLDEEPIIKNNQIIYQGSQRQTAFGKSLGTNKLQFNIEFTVENSRLWITNLKQ